MHETRRVRWPLAIVLLASTLMVTYPRSSEGQLLGRWRRNGYSGSVLTNPLTTVTKPLAGLIRQRVLDRDEYDYNWAARRDWHGESAAPALFADRVRVRVLLSQDHLALRDKLRVRATWVYLHKSQTPYTAWLPLEQEGDQVYFDLGGLEEGRLVKITPDLYLATEEAPSDPALLENATFVQNDEGTFRFRSRWHTPYYGVTSSEDNEELQRRARIVSFGLSQWYVDEAYGGRACPYDCYSFYQTSASGELEGFSLRPVAHAQVPALSREGKRFHGDYLIMPGHYGMALCYDEDTGNFCTLEGNYALNGPYRINIDPYYHGLHAWSSILTISPDTVEQ